MFKNITTKKIVISTSTIIIIVSFIIFKINHKKTDYIITPAIQGTLTQTISANGKYLSKDEANVSFQISGRVTSIKAHIGDKVRKGQLLATIDTGTLSNKLQQAKEKVKAQKKILAYQNKKDDLYSREQKDSQRAIIKAGEAVVNEINKKLSYATIKAPMSGTIVKKNINIGEIEQAGNPAFTIIKENEMRIEARIPEVDISNVKIGQKVSVKFDAYPENKRFKATIVEIDPAPVTIQNISYYIVKANIENPDPGFKYGMNNTIYDETNRKNNILMIPAWTIEKKDGKQFVSIITDTKNKIIEKKEIKTGISGDGGMVEVISGLKKGDQIVTKKIKN